MLRTFHIKPEFITITMFSYLFPKKKMTCLPFTGYTIPGEDSLKKKELTM